MSGRNPHFSGFDDEKIEGKIHANSLVVRGLDKCILNKLISIGNLFQIERIEFFNAIYIYFSVNECAGLRQKFPSALVFLAALRLSVFSRRRRDILHQNQENVHQIMLSSNVQIECISRVESHILSQVGCCIWDNRANIVEAIYLNLGKVDLNSESILILRGTSIDVALILLDESSMSEIGIYPITAWEGALVSIVTAMSILGHSPNISVAAGMRYLHKIGVTDRVVALTELLVDFIVK
jgi:hypothetical protein